MVLNVLVVYTTDGGENLTPKPHAGLAGSFVSPRTPMPSWRGRREPLAPGRAAILYSTAMHT
jgi:hypothetical protein